MYIIGNAMVNLAVWWRQLPWWPAPLQKEPSQRQLALLPDSGPWADVAGSSSPLSCFNCGHQMWPGIYSPRRFYQGFVCLPALVNPPDNGVQGSRDAASRLKLLYIGLDLVLSIRQLCCSAGAARGVLIGAVPIAIVDSTALTVQTLSVRACVCACVSSLTHVQSWIQSPAVEVLC